jgi:hypothetical protein
VSAVPNIIATTSEERKRRVFEEAETVQGLLVTRQDDLGLLIARAVELDDQEGQDVLETILLYISKLLEQWLAVIGNYVDGQGADEVAVAALHDILRAYQELNGD